MTSLALWTTPVGLYTSTILLGAGSALLFPSLLLAAVGEAPVRERTAILATFTISLDVVNAMAPIALGVVVAVLSYRSAFLNAAGLALVAMALLLGGHTGHVARGEEASSRCSCRPR